MIDDWDFLTRSYKKHGYYYFAKMPISFSKNDYEAVLTQEIGPNEDENILTLANKIVILPNSLSWMIYGERETELSVLGFNSSMKYQDEGWLPLGDEIFEQISVAFSNQTVPEPFKEKLFRNYK
jgi:hypothetical protein